MIKTSVTFWAMYKRINITILISTLLNNRLFFEKMYEG